MLLKRRKNIAPIEEQGNCDVHGLDTNLFKDYIPSCSKCNQTFDCGWSSSLGTFVVIDIEKNGDDEYRHKRGMCTGRKSKRRRIYKN